MKRSTWLWLLALALVAGGWSLSRALVPTAAGDRVTRGKVVNIVIGSVTVSTEAESQIAAPLEGLLKTSTLVPGQEVKMGEVLAQFDPGDIELKRKQDDIKLDGVKRSLARQLPSEITLINLQNQLATNKALLEGKFYAPAQYEAEARAVEAQNITARQERDTFVTEQHTLEKSLEIYDYQLAQLKITAPYDGTIIAVAAHSGEMVAKGAPVASIISRKLRILAEVNQDDIANVFEKEEADVRFTAYGTKRFTAVVLKVLPSSDKTTQRFTVELELKEPPLNIMAGLTGEVIFHAGEHDHALRIPRRALYGNNVFVVKNDRVEKRSVKPGFVTLMQAEILPDANPQTTVAEGDVVLTDNLDLFRDGDRVRVVLPADAAQK